MENIIDFIIEVLHFFLEIWRWLHFKRIYGSILIFIFDIW